MIAELLTWLQETHGPLPYLVLGLCGLLEYVFPPFPGDTVTLFGAFLAATAGWSPLGVYAVLNAGALGGGLSTYAAGRWLADRRETHMPRFLHTARARRLIDRAILRFERHGAAYLALNRFLPAMRSIFFLAAGLARLPVHEVALYGGLSALAWNGLLMAAGWLVGDNFDRLLELSRVYSYGALALVALVAVFFGVRALVRRRREAREDAAEAARLRDGDGTAPPPTDGARPGVPR